MNKYKLNSRRQVFVKYGPDLAVTEGKVKVKLKLYPSLKRLNKFTPGAVLPYNQFNYNIRTKGLLFQPCATCGATENVEMHHRRPLRQKNTDNTLKGIVQNLSRKQIPLCRPCHIKVHRGEYDGPGIY